MLKMTKLQESKVTLIKMIIVMEEVEEDLKTNKIMDGVMETTPLLVIQGLITTLKMIRLQVQILENL
jgi:hypothetical protein